MELPALVPEIHRVCQSDARQILTIMSRKLRVFISSNVALRRSANRRSRSAFFSSVTRAYSRRALCRANSSGGKLRMTSSLLARSSSLLARASSLFNSASALFDSAAAFFSSASACRMASCASRKGLRSAIGRFSTIRSSSLSFILSGSGGWWRASDKGCCVFKRRKMRRSPCFTFAKEIFQSPLRRSA